MDLKQRKINSDKKVQETITSQHHCICCALITRPIPSLSTANLSVP